jgi:hypothetical protein
MKRAHSSGGATQRLVRQQIPPPIPALGTHNKAAIIRRKYAGLVAVPRKMNTAAKEVYYDVDNTNAKKESFDHFETNEAALWRSIAAAKQGSDDHLKLRKSHKKVVKLMDGIVTYFVRYAEPTTDPTALASGSTATSAALAQSQRVQRAAFGDTAMAPPPTELDHITTGASMTASTAASQTALASAASATSHLDGT